MYMLLRSKYKDEDGRRNGVHGIVGGGCPRMGWDEGLTQGLNVCAKEYGDWMMVGVGECPG